MNLADYNRDLSGACESQELELKRSLAETNEGLQSLCGMLNTDEGKGTVIFGIGPDGQLVGVEPGNLDKAQQTLVSKINSNFEPPIIPDIKVQGHKDKSVITVVAGRDKRVPYHEYDGRAFIREGTVTRQLSLSEKQRIQKGRDRDHHNGPWRCDKCGAMVGILSGWVVSNSGMSKSYHCECGGEFWPA